MSINYTYWRNGVLFITPSYLWACKRSARGKKYVGKIISYGNDN